MIKVEEKLYVNADVFFDKIAESIAIYHSINR